MLQMNMSFKICLCREVCIAQPTRFRTQCYCFRGEGSNVTKLCSDKSRLLPAFLKHSSGKGYCVGDLLLVCRSSSDPRRCLRCIEASRHRKVYLHRSDLRRTFCPILCVTNDCAAHESRKLIETVCILVPCPQHEPASFLFTLPMLTTKS